MVVALWLLVGLLVVDWQVALTAVVALGLVYSFLVVSNRPKLAANSAVIAQASQQQLKALQEGLGAIRDVLLDGSQSACLDIYRRADRPLRMKQAQSAFLSMFPRYCLEAVGLLLIAVLALFLTQQRGSSSAVIPMLGTLALGAQRLLPALQQGYGSWAVIRAYGAAVIQVLAMLDQPIPDTSLKSRQAPFRLQVALDLEQMSFRYSNEAPWVIDSINLNIYRGEVVGIIGSTGSGKSTLVDIIMGLLEPTAGRVLIDGQDLYDLEYPERLMAWRANIAHVPQSIYLTDTSIAENIAFGVPKDKIDLAKVRHAAQQAQIAAFIESSPHGYESFVGERGTKLSGGQRQRIGIARALYKQAQFLVFDEATSALDTSTEKAVMEAIQALRNQLTIVLIAHRLSTVASCDRVIRLAHGVIDCQGKPQEVLTKL